MDKKQKLIVVVGILVLGAQFLYFGISQVSSFVAERNAEKNPLSVSNGVSPQWGQVKVMGSDPKRAKGVRPLLSKKCQSTSKN